MPGRTEQPFKRDASRKTRTSSAKGSFQQSFSVLGRHSGFHFFGIFEVKKESKFASCTMQGPFLSGRVRAPNHGTAGADFTIHALPALFLSVCS